MRETQEMSLSSGFQTSHSRAQEAHDTIQVYVRARLPASRCQQRYRGIGPINNRATAANHVTLLPSGFRKPTASLVPLNSSH